MSEDIVKILYTAVGAAILAVGLSCNRPILSPNTSQQNVSPGYLAGAASGQVVPVDKRAPRVYHLIATGSIEDRFRVDTQSAYLISLVTGMSPERVSILEAEKGPLLAGNQERYPRCDKATRATIHQYFKRASRNLTDVDCLFVSFIGHGDRITDKATGEQLSAFCVYKTSDSASTAIGTDYYTENDLKEDLKNIKARVVFVTGACHGGGMARAAVSHAHTIATAACDADETARPQKGASFVTGFFMRLYSLPDENNDGLRSFYEAFVAGGKAELQESEGNYHPVLLKSNCDPNRSGFSYVEQKWVGYGFDAGK